MGHNLEGHILDHPIWHALNSKQANLAEGDALAKRFPYEIGPLCGISEQSEEAYAALATLSQPDEPMVMFLDEPPVVPECWHWVVGGELTQMVCGFLKSVEITEPIVPLTEADVPEMLALTRLTQPGPFRERTLELGNYVGIRQSGRLAAMAGERLHLDGYAEVSAVCTHPDFQGRGYSKALVTTVSQRILARGETPFLHTRPDNLGAIHVYETLGFHQRRLLHLAVIRMIALRSDFNSGNSPVNSRL